ncbi:hypothetical protein HALLA_03900 (plasmid) [Halostagnicola larsenii XH-48]|uniref:Uncharacterized protein n=1 Tax=Halostagnicola larsenii XH-48 TaxID=797299 RepID=W0JW41_9EURY|nr:hypothetical protein [Halostagnicola larsenii]AHG01547.1 hypothetical protein HALLA_03900 [Halostagnicola larsenii XH-48]
MSPSTSNSTTEQHPDHRSESFEALEKRIDALEAELERKDDRLADLEQECDRLDNRTATLEERVADLESETTRLENMVEAALKKASANKERVSELQSRELEKGAHLLEETVDAHAVNVLDGRLERLTKDDGNRYYRVPDSADPLERGGTVSLAYGDLLPIQQLAKMDEEMRRSAANALPTRLAAKLWNARVDDSVGDNPWKTGCKDVAEYVKASDLKHWIRRQESGISETYAKKLVSRTIDAVLDLSKNRLAVRKRTERKNGLEYTERRLVLPADAAIPGESGSRTEQNGDPKTGGVHG